MYESTNAALDPGGNLYDKFGSRNPISRFLMKRFLKAFSDLVAISKAHRAYEIGCGEGHILLHLARMGLAVVGGDPSEKAIFRARENIKNAGFADAIEVSIQNIYNLLPIHPDPDLIVCCEVLEHLERPGEAINGLAQKTPGYLLVSVPREPLWRFLNVLRGSYLRDLGNTPGHIQHFSLRSLLKLLDPHFEIVEIRKPLPWLMVLCRAKESSMRVDQ